MKPNTDANVNLFERARQVIPGGVNSPVRAFLRSAAALVSLAGS